MLDFLVEERCHACGTALDENGPPYPADPLALPVPVVGHGRWCLSTRLLCGPCARAIRVWREPVLLDDEAAGRAAGAPLSVYPAFATDERLLVLVHLLKFQRRERLAPWLARAMADGLPARARDGVDAPPVLVPVPMDRAARTRRGFNQAERIAEELGRSWDVPVAARALVKRRPTPPQSSLDRDRRRENLRDAFACGPDSVRHTAVILVDDLVTTGATARACARELSRAGASSVRVACLGYRR